MRAVFIVLLHHACLSGTSVAPRLETARIRAVQKFPPVIFHTARKPRKQFRRCESVDPLTPSKDVGNEGERQQQENK